MTRSTRALAWFAIAAQFIFIAAWVVAGALEDGYSHTHDYISELGADGAANPGIVNAAIVVLGLAFAALAVALRRVLPKNRAGLVAAVLFALIGLAFVLAGIFNGDCSTAVDATCQHRYDEWDVSTAAKIHVWAAFGGELLSLATPFALARALWNRPAAAPALASGIIGVGLAVARVFGESAHHGPDGLVQRLAFGTLHLWAIIIAVGILWATRSGPRLPAATPLPPSKFFATTWVGTGELVPWPYFVWRRFAQRVRVRRRATFLTDETWYFDDEIQRADGTLLEERRVWCTLTTPDRVHVTADPLLDGTQILLEEDGYRIVPYRVTYAVGPVHFGVNVRDTATVDDDTLVNRLYVSWFGLPVARVEVRVRPET